MIIYGQFMAIYVNEKILRSTSTGIATCKNAFKFVSKFELTKK